jgi:hypothetical protein
VDACGSDQVLGPELAVHPKAANIDIFRISLVIPLQSLLFHCPTESAMAAFTGAFAASQNAFESAQSSAKKAMEVAQSNFTAATKQTVDAVKKAAKIA